MKHSNMDIETVNNTIIHGDALEVLKTLPSDSIDCVITSPPYWGLRDYQVSGQLGLEKTFEEYITKLCNILDEVKRVLKKEGTCFVNIGDTYLGSGCGSGDKRQFQNLKRKDIVDQMYLKYPPAKNYMKQAKCLALIPFRFSLEMVNRGWICRNTCIWYKPNAMPSSVKDRFGVDFEYIFFFVKSKKYYFHLLKVPLAESSYHDKRRGKVISKNAKWDGYQKQTIGRIKSFAYIDENGRNMRCVWTIPTTPYKKAHFATFPETLIEPIVKAGCPKGGIILDPFIGAGTTGVVAKKLGRNYIGIELNKGYCKMARNRINNTEGTLI